MNRRQFVERLIGAGLIATLDPERLLWTPGTKLISIPALSPIDHRLAQFVTVYYNRQALDQLERQFVFGDMLHSTLLPPRTGKMITFRA